MPSGAFVFTHSRTDLLFNLKSRANAVILYGLWVSHNPHCIWEAVSLCLSLFFPLLHSIALAAAAWWRSKRICVSWRRDGLCLLGIKTQFYLLLCLLFLSSFPAVIVSALRVIVFPVFFRCVSSSARIHEHVGRLREKKNEKKKKKLAHFWALRQACSVCVCSNIHESIIWVFFFYLYLRLLWIPLSLSTHKPHWLRSREITGEWSRAQWLPVGKPWDAALARIPFHPPLGCKKSSIVERACDSAHISLSLKSRLVNRRPTLIYLSGRF